MVINIEGPKKLDVLKSNLMNIISKNNIVLRSAFRFATMGNRNYAIYNNGVLVGFALTTPDNFPRLKLNIIATKGGRKGYGSQLMSRIKSNAKRNKFEQINLNSVNSVIAKNFYKKQNFKKNPREILNSSLTYYIV